MNTKSSALFEILAPSPGESIAEVQISKWLVSDGQVVKRDQDLLEIESEKASLQIQAEKAGKISIKAQAGDTVQVKSVIAVIDTSVAPDASAPQVETKAAPSAPSSSAKAPETAGLKLASPAAEKMIAENKLSKDALEGSAKGGRITKGDVIQALEKGVGAEKAAPAPATATGKAVTEKRGPRSETREKMSPLRKKVAERLLAAKNETAMLTTFNEVDLSEVMAIRKKYKEIFKEKHNVGLGFMSFFSKAASTALLEFGAVNSQIQDQELVRYHYVDLGIAVSAPKGLMVPVLRNVESKSLAEIERGILELATKARNNQITVDDMAGGTFTITNGGVFGSMLSTPIINYPQCAILGMHNIVERPVVVNGQIVIRPMMYLALSYDHRIIDGKEAVSFLVRIKELLEDPDRLLLEV